ncbi:MAG: V-type ATP synthase subunit D [Candidatus Hydrogenedentes bacterium]|nr:V-type ATP synthase subunit D [Candidatus Hydrogenedentota bacterium]
MPRYELAPTRTNLLRLKGDLAFALEGYELLEQKREILMSELKRVTDRAVEAQRTVDAELEKAYRALREAKTAVGNIGIESAACAINMTTELHVHERHVMGVAIPTVEMAITESPPHYGPTLTSAWTDEAANRFRSALEALTVLAETRIAVVRLAREIQKTIRRVNALEKIFIPDYRETKKYVEDALEEADRGALSLLKLVKEKLENVQS